MTTPPPPPQSTSPPLPASAFASATAVAVDADQFADEPTYGRSDGARLLRRFSASRAATSPPPPPRRQSSRRVSSVAASPIPPQDPLRDLGGDDGGHLTGRVAAVVTETPVPPHPKITPLPLLKVIVISSVLFCNSFNTTVLIPFIPFMVEDWGVADPNEVGKYSGFVIASYMFGQMLFSYPVGMAADVIGRKPALLIGLLGSCIFTFLFGFSSSFYEALVYRIICGSLNGIVSITKTTLSEITDSSNQGLAFSILGLARAVGLVVGPSYPGIFPPGSLFDRYAYALPCIVGAAVSGTGFLASIFVLEETKKFPPGEDGSLQSVTTALGHTVGDACRDAAAHVHRLATAAFAVVRAAGLSSWQPRHDRATPIDLENDPVNCADGAGEDEPLLGRQRAASPAAEDTHGQLSDDATSVTVSLGRKGPMTAWELLNDRKIFLSILLYAFISALYIQYDEIFSLWSRMPREQGGLAFTTSDIGIVFSVGGVSLFFYQLFLYAPIERRLGPLGTFKWGILFSLPVFLVLPHTGLLQPASQEGTSWRVWVVAIICQILRTCAGLQAFTSSFILTANSCPAHSRGSANGLTQSFGAFSRMVGPIFAGNLFSWSVESGLPCPFDYHLIYYILALATLGIYAVSRIVPRDADVRVEEVLDPLTDDEDDEEN